MTEDAMPDPVDQAVAELDQAPPAAGGPSVADLDAEIARLTSQRAAVAAGDTVRLRVEEPHVAFTYGMTTVGREYTDVPAAAAGALAQSAAEAGVTLTQET